MKFSDIPLRSVTRVLPDWWNSLKLAGERLESLFGDDFVVETSFTIANNQASAADVTGLVFDKTAVRSAQIEFQIRRYTGSSERMAHGRITLLLKAGAWEDPNIESVGDDCGVTLTVTAAGQIQYVTDNQSGTSYVGEIRFRATTFSI